MEYDLVNYSFVSPIFVDNLFSNISFKKMYWLDITCRFSCMTGFYCYFTCVHHGLMGLIFDSFYSIMIHGPNSLLVIVRLILPPLFHSCFLKRFENDEPSFPRFIYILVIKFKLGSGCSYPSLMPYAHIYKTSDECHSRMVNWECNLHPLGPTIKMIFKMLCYESIWLRIYASIAVVHSKDVNKYGLEWAKWSQ